MKRYGLNTLVEEELKQPSMDSVVWLLVLTLMFYNEKEKYEQVKIQNVDEGVKVEPGSGMDLIPVFKEINILKILKA